MTDKKWIEKLAREHGTGGWQSLDDMVRFGTAVAAYSLKDLEQQRDELLEALKCAMPYLYKGTEAFLYAKELIARIEAEK